MALLAESQLADGCPVHLCVMGRGGPLGADLAAKGAAVTILGNGPTIDPRRLWRLRRQVAKLWPDVIHAWGLPSCLHAYLATRGAEITPPVVTLRETDPDRPWPEGILPRYLLRRVSGVVFNSRTVKRRYEGYGLSGEKCRVIHEAIPEPRPTKTTRRQWLAELGLPGEGRLIGLVSPLHLSQRIKDAIWTADLLKVIRDDVHLLIIGEGPHGDRLRKFRDQVNIRDKVHFLAPRRDLSSLMPHFDVFWSTAARGGPSKAMIRAMAAGVPVVATDIFGTRELIRDAAIGCLIGVGDRAALGRATTRLLDNAELAEQFGHAGREHIRREFPVEKMVQQFAELYAELLTT